MAGPRRTTFRDSLLVSGLVTREQLAEAEAEVRALVAASPQSVVEATDELLAERLLDLGWLTRYQVDQLRAGRTKLNLGPYIVTDFIGEGGMGQVFKAVHEMMGRACAVKVLPRHKSTPEAINNFRREIRMQAQLDHPNLVRAFDAGHDGNVHYLVTEYVAGTDLRRLVRGQGPLSMQQAANVIMQSARGLQYAHEQGLLHRDVKPGNILVTPEGVAKVSDLGLAGFMHEGEQDPRAGKILGTADYLSPEQIRNPLDISPASDIYSLGCTLYYAVTGKVPFPGGTTADKARRHLEDTPWHPRRFNSEVSEEFVEIIADMMEKDPRKRAQSAGDLVARLEPWCGQSDPIPSQMTRSPWLPPPLPTGSDNDLQDTQVGLEENDSRSQSASQLSQISQTTDPLASAKQETVRTRQPGPPLALEDSAGPSGDPVERVVPLLLFASAASFVAGAALGLLLGWLLL